MPDSVEIILKIIAKNPPTVLFGGGFILLVLSPANPKFSGWGWGLIILGFILQIIWLYLQYSRTQTSWR